MGIASTTEDAPANDTVIFSGKVPQFVANYSDLILIGPVPPISPKVMQGLAVVSKVTVIVGEYSQNKDFWNEEAKLHPNIKVQVVDGMEDYISDWAHQIALAVEVSDKVTMPVTTK